MNVLVSLHRGYGLGDGVQMSAVLRHVAAARPNWEIDYQAEEGRHQVGRGIVNNTFAYATPYPSPHYDAEVLICLYDTWCNWGDRPNTRVSSALHERFGLPWLPQYGRYCVYVSPDAEAGAAALVHGVSQASALKELRYTKTMKVRRRCVAVHYEGDSSKSKKDLTHEQADRICATIEKLDCVPIILDWRSKCPLEYKRLRHPSDWGSNAENVCAVIRQCSAFVGIDSGPSKCASATDTPALVVWTGHHPAPFHDPAPNTTHLVPQGYHGLEPVCEDRGVIDWFERNYNVRQYEGCPVSQIQQWLAKVLK